MPESEGAQAKPKGKQASTEVWDDLFAKGWAKEVESEPAPAPAPAKSAEDECPDCPKPGEPSKDKTPIRVLKHKGKDVPVYSQKQLDDLAQQGFDYTQKRQADSEDRKRWEVEFEAKSKILADQAARLDALIKAAESTSPKPADAAPAQPAAGGDDEASILKSYGIDPEYATEYEKKTALKLHESEQGLKKVEQVAKIMLINEVFRRVTSAIDEAQKEYPIDDVKDEKGESVTQKQVLDVFRKKVGEPENRHRPIQEIARETIKEIHEAQKGAATAAKPAEDLESLSPEDFKKKYPALYAKISGNGGEGELPPSMDRRSQPPARGMRTAPSSDRHKFKSLEEAIEAGFKDPDTIKALTGG